MCNKVTGVGISRTTLTLEEAGTHRLTATIAPPKATNPNVTWSTSNASVATVDSGGNVSAKSAGTAKIRVTTKDGGFWQECTVTVLRVQISKTSLSLYEKENSKLTVTVTPSNTNNSISWSSSCKSVATVDSSGMVCAKSAGTSTIAVTCGGITKTCKLTVSKKVSKVTCVSLKPTSLSLKAGESDFLVATVAPVGASNNNITWKSSCTDIATVSSSGRVYAIAPGTATITVKSGDGGTECTKTCKVTVTKNDSGTGGTNISVTDVDIEEVDEINHLIKIGENCTLRAVVYPEKASNKEVIWDSIDKSIVKVNSSGLVCPKKEGETKITVMTKDNNKVAEYDIKVLPAVPITGIKVEKVSESSNTVQLKAVLTPTTATGAVNWHSSDESIATVSSSGLVTRHKPGMVMITAMPVTTILSIATFFESIGKFFEDVAKWLANLFGTIWDGIKSLWESIFGGGREDTETASPSATVVITETPGPTETPGDMFPPETPSTGNTSDKYFVNDAVKIRDSANGNQINGNKVFKTGAIVKIVPPMETKKVTGSDYTWIKVYYEGNKIGWVAKEFLEELPKSFSGHSFKYKWDKSEFVTSAFKDKAAGISKRLNIEPDDLMAVMAFESYFNPAQVNNAGGSATGLIQFMPSVAEELNTTTTELKSMTGVEQLDYVFGYFYPCAGQMNNLGDVYMKVLCPSGIGKSDSDVLWSKGSDAYNSNSGLDTNQDGKITRGEAVQKVIDRRKNYE